jgi:hypothetical protein
MATSRPAAGWYRDPSGRFEHRYWNGSGWTDHVQAAGVRTIDDDHGARGEPDEATTTAAPAPGVTPAEPEAGPEDAAKPEDTEDAEVAARPSFAVSVADWPLVVQLLVLGGAALMAVAAFLPWAEASSAAASFSERGIDGYGAVTLLAAAVIALAFLLLPHSVRAGVAVAACAAGALAVAVYDAADLSRRADDLVARLGDSVTAGVAIGLWLTIAAAVVCLVGGVVALLVARR